MGDSETVVAQTSAVSEFSSAGHSASVHDDATMNAAPESGVSASGDDVLPTDGTAISGGLSSSDTVPASGDSVAGVTPANGDLSASTVNMDADNVNIGQEAGNSEPEYMNCVQEQAPSSKVQDINENPTAFTNTSVDSSEVATYDSSADGNGVKEAKSTGASENGINSYDFHGSPALQQELNVLSKEEEKLWSTLRANSLDFSAWTALIEETEKMQETNIIKIRKVYDAFLAEFPLCYGYWKKYADHEARVGSPEKVVEVYERAVLGVTYSVDMWLHYCVFAINTYGDADIIRRLFERGLAYVGSDYLSFPLWDKYIEYEYQQQQWSRLAMIYTRILENPNQQLDRYFASFKELVASRPLSELRSAEEASATASANTEAVNPDIEGEVHYSTVDQSPKPVSAGMTEAEELQNYIAIREELFKKAKEFDSKIINFETAIRRPYFHFKSLNVAEVENWHNYLNFIEGVADLNKVIKLYERCLIACANYPEYWIRYVLCMEASGSVDLAENALARATQVFVKRQPEIHLFAARFREHCGDIPGARASYQLVHTEISPGLLEAIINHASMEYRLGNVEDACSLYEQTITIEKGKEHSQTLPLVFAQYSRFLYLVLGRVEKAREVLDEALENSQLSKTLLEALIHMESILPLPKRIEYLDNFVEKFIVPGSDNSNAASVIEREELSSIYLEFLNLFGDTKTIKKADDRHAKLFLQHRSTSESKKRQLESCLPSDRAKIARTEVLSSVPSVMGAYQSAQSQWPASYGVQPQAWPQASQVQGQQWQPSYAQQAAYGTYGAYGTSYSQSQTPVSAPAPQPAAYGAYPSYPVQQAVAQQVYAQPAVSATLTPAQPPASVPQAYYGTYY